jgi:hypothetical protein
MRREPDADVSEGTQKVGLGNTNIRDSASLGRAKTEPNTAVIPHPDNEITSDSRVAGMALNNFLFLVS